MDSGSFYIYISCFCLFAIFFSKVLYPLTIELYFKHSSFLSIKSRVAQHISECNALNMHVESLKWSYSDVASTNYGSARLVDTSVYNMDRPKWSSELRSKRTHYCSASVAKNADNQPYKYFCKYFNVSADKATLEKFEQVLNDFSAAREGQAILVKEREDILSNVRQSIPWFLLEYHRERVMKELGLQKISLSDIYYPVYTFKYVSAGGKSGFNTLIKLDIDWLEGFIADLSNSIKFKQSVAGQRSLMTGRLREKIKQRDNYTCQICSLSTFQEPNLLLEIDHIVPLSKGGITSEDNLQTLCWKCNRSKGSKIDNSNVSPSSPDSSASIRPSSSDSSVSIRPSSSDSSASIRPSSSDSSASIRPSSSDSSASIRPSLTKSQSNALKNAKEYLSCTGYSYKGLIEQLHEGDQYSTADAKAAVDSMDIDWRKQAVKTAKEYLSCTGYSYKGLIEQLHEGDQYSTADAKAAVDSMDVDWRKQAVKTAKEYLSCTGYSYKGLIEQLHEGDQYSMSEATYAVNQLGID